MDLHHKLRRDPTWHPSACNICGQLGHQAVACTIGTINWKRIFGDGAFKLRGPLYFSEIDKKLAQKHVDHTELERRARDYAKTQAEAQGLSYEDIEAHATHSVLDWEAGKSQQRMQSDAHAEVMQMQMQQQQLQQQQQQQQQMLMQQQQQQQQQMGVQDSKMEQYDAKKQVKEETGGLPGDWAVAYDPQGRAYYWHKVTSKVQWEKPTSDTPTT